MNATWDTLEGNRPNGLKWGPVIAASLLFHAAAVAGMFFVPESISIRRPHPGVVYEVQLVEMPGGGGQGKAAAPKKPAAQPKTESPAKSKKAVSIPEKKPARRIAPVQREKKPVVVAKKTAKTDTKPAKKKKEVSPSELIERAISRIERKEKAKTPSPSKTSGEGHLEQALTGLEARAREQGGTGSGREGGFMGTAMQIYMAKVHDWISSNWSYPVALQSGEENLEATVVLTVQRDGTITSTRIAQRSSNTIFDESVLRAIERSDPLPPFPEVYRRSHDEFEIRFSLEELEEY